MKTVILQIDHTRPPTASTSSSAAGKASLDHGYLIIDPDGNLSDKTLYLFLEQAQIKAGAGRVISRAWWERKHNTTIITQ
jgi:hypothetical protein